MSHDPDIADLGARIHRAESDRDGWRAKGNQERYLDAYFLAEALEVARDRLRTQRRHSLVLSESLTRRAPTTRAARARGFRRRLASCALSMIGGWWRRPKRLEAISTR